MTQQMNLQRGLVGHWTMSDNSTPANQAVNKSFEDDSLGDDTPTGWTDDSGNWIITDEVSNSQTFSFGNYYDGDASGGSGRSAGVYPSTFAYQEFTNVDEGEKYLASVYLFSPSGGGNGDGSGGQTQYVWEDDGRLRVTAFDSSDSQIGRFETIWMGETTDLNTNEWNRREVEFTVPSGTEYIHLNIDGGDGNNSEIDKDSGHGGNAGLFIDDVLLRKQKTYDSSAYDNHGSLTGSPATGQNGQVGESYEFDGTNSDTFVDVPVSNSLESPGDTDEITISAFVRPDFTNMDSRGTVCTGNGIYYLQVQSAGNISVYTYNDGGGGSSYMDSNSTLSGGQWYHIVFTESGGTRRIYIDGSVDKSGSFTAEIDSTMSEFGIGQEGSGNRQFDGRIDDVRVYNRELSANEVNQLYQMRTQRNYYI